MGASGKDMSKRRGHGLRSENVLRDNSKSVVGRGSRQAERKGGVCLICLHNMVIYQCILATTNCY